MTQGTLHQVRRRVGAWCLLLAGAALSGRARAADQAPGVVVYEVTPEGAAASAGMQLGDEVLAWSREARPPANPATAQGDVASPFDSQWLETEQAPRGPVTLSGQRGGVQATWTLQSEDWGLRTRPALPEPLGESFREARRLEDANSSADAVPHWQRAAAAAGEAGDRALESWLLGASGRALAAAGRWDAADAAFGRGLELLEGAQLPRWEALLAGDWCQATRSRGTQPALDCYDRARQLAERVAPESLLLAQYLIETGRFAARASLLERAESCYRRALEIQDRQCPESRSLAVSFSQLGAVAYSRADFEAAEDQFRRAVAVSERVEPDTLRLANYLGNLGETLRRRGDLDAAEAIQLRALAIKRRVAPGGAYEGASLTNLGLLALSRGDLAAAEEYLTHALRAKEKEPSEHVRVTPTLNNLGHVALARGDMTAAESYFRRAVESAEREGPAGLGPLEPLANLGKVAFERGDVAAAEELWRRVLARREELAPGLPEEAQTLDDLGRAARVRGDLPGAEVYHKKALAIREKRAPGSLSVAESLHNLGDLARVQGDADRAEGHLRAALAIRERLAPGGADVADTLHALGLNYAGQPERAVQMMCAAVDALESQRARLGGTDEARSAFGRWFGGYYHDCMAGLIGQGRMAEAYHILERSRARSFLQMLAERDLVFASAVPPDLLRAGKLVDAEYDRVQAAIARLDPARDQARIATSLSRLQELRERQAELARSVRAASPQFASLRYPQPLDLAAAREALDPGTVLLAYSVGAESSLLFAVSAPGVPGSGLTVIPLAAGRNALGKKVDAFRSAILPRSRSSREVLTRHAAELYDLLVRPAEAEIGRAERVLLSPDGPLHSLPFGALVRGAPHVSGTLPQYLVEWRPIHLVASATLYAEIKRSRRPALPPGRLVAFGDPRYPAAAKAEGIGNAELRAAVGRGLDLTPLPLTRDEVLGISRRFPGASATFLGAEATEERAKTLGRDVRYVHFACHGSLDERFPLNSALALTIPQAFAEGQDNGLLQAWEIFDQVRIDADLVTLSACDTGLGAEMGGEGLLGLTRAFLYAGARSVVGSLWAVSDKSTPRLMRRFYAHLGTGLARDEALRAAQIELIRKRPAAGKAWAARTSHPFHWAAFQLSGDWR